MTDSDDKLFRHGLLIVALLALVIGLAYQGSRGLYETTEGRYTLCAWEMVRSGNWFEPTLTGHPHWTKPPFAYWSIAVGLQTFGRNAWGARLPNVLAFVVTVLLAGFLGRRMWDSRTGLLTAAVYATAVYPVFVASTVNTDTVLAMWEMAAVLGFWFADTSSDPRASRRWVCFMWCMFGLGFLTKGPPVLLPLLAMLVYRWLTPHGRHAARLLQWPGLIAFVLLGLGWYVAMVIRHPELTSYFVGDEIINRVASDKFRRNPQWYQPFRMYVPLLLLGGGLWAWYPLRLLVRWPWWKTESWRQLRRDAGPGLFLILWLALPLIVFSLSKSRLPNYVVPLFPITALVTARCAVRGWRDTRMPAHLLWLAGLSFALLIALKAVVAYAPLIAARIARVEKPVVVRNLGERVLRQSKVDMSQLYRLCQPYDDPATTRFVLYEQDRLFGFDVYATSTVVRAFEDPTGAVHARDLTGVLQEIKDRSIPQVRHVFVCRDYTIPDIRKRFDLVGLKADDVAADAFWHLLVVTAP